MTFLVFLLAALCASTEQRQRPAWLRRPSAEDETNIKHLTVSTDWNPDTEIKRFQATSPVKNKLLNSESLSKETDSIRKSREGNLIYKGFDSERVESSQVEREILMQSAARDILPEVVPNIFRHYFQAEDKQLESTRFWVVMEKVEGTALEDLVTREDWSSHKAAIILPQLKEAIKILNAKGFAHNDLHLENIYVSPDLKVSIIDFGESQNNVINFETDEVALNLITKILESEDLNSRKELCDEIKDVIGLIRQRRHTASPAISEVSTVTSMASLENEQRFVRKY